MTHDPLAERAREVLASHLTDAPPMSRDLFNRAVAAMIELASDHSSEQTKALREALAESGAVSIGPNGRDGQRVLVDFEQVTPAAFAVFNFLSDLHQSAALSAPVKGRGDGAA